MAAAWPGGRRGPRSATSALELGRLDHRLHRLLPFEATHQRTLEEAVDFILGGGKANPNLGVSNTIRGAVASWAKTLATELGGYGITVNKAQIPDADIGSISLLFANGDRVMVPQIEGADIDVGDDVEVSRNHQGNYPESVYSHGINLLSGVGAARAISRGRALAVTDSAHSPG